jgi:hypothetical protein
MSLSATATYMIAWNGQMIHADYLMNRVQTSKHNHKM